MTSISDLPGDLVGEILSKVLLTSLREVRLTCKKWNGLSKYQIFGKAATRNQFLGFMMIDFKVCSMRLDLQGIDRNNFVYPSIKQVSIPDQVQISQIFHCGGLLLCVTKNHSRLLVWNPYLGQTRWISPRIDCGLGDKYSLGHENNNLNHKILRIFDRYEDTTYNHFFGFEIYDLNSYSWRVLDVNTNWDIEGRIQCRVILKGNTYFVAQDPKRLINDFLLCFDFTQERLGPPLRLPCSGLEPATLSCSREEQLAVFYERWKPCGRLFEGWVTTKIEPNALSWSKFFKVVMTPGFPTNFDSGSFFIDEEKKVVVVSDVYGYVSQENFRTAYIISNDGCFKYVNIGEVLNLRKPDVFEDADSLHPFLGGEYQDPLVFSSYVPSLVQVQLQIQKPGKRKERDY